MDDSDRVVVKTYVPEQQKSNWKTHADELDMSQSEFVRTMIQAGRRTFNNGSDAVPDIENTSETSNSPEVEDGGSSTTTPGGDTLETRVLDALENGSKSWDELLESVTGDLEEDLDETLQTLQEAGTVRYSGRAGGYELNDQ